MIQKIITINGKKKLEDEYDNLLKIERPAILQAIEEARAHGDLKENAEYHAAKERQLYIQMRIDDISTKLASSEVVDPSKTKSDKIVFGAHVTILNLDTNEDIKYQIVGEDEANVNEGSVFYLSPIAQALIGKKVDDEVLVRTPKGETEYQIINIEYK